MQEQQANNFQQLLINKGYLSDRRPCCDKLVLLFTTFFRAFFPR
jgi:hypothetical protein